MQLDKYKRAVLETQAFYDRIAQYYDEFVPPDKMRANRTKSLIPYISNKLPKKRRQLHILELGCGTGSYAIPLAERGHFVTGVDISEKMKDVAFRKLGGVLPKNFEYLTADWLTIVNRLEREFDCVLCIGNSLIHNPQESLPDIFAGVFRALKPGGLLILNGRRIEQELDMPEGPDNSQNEVYRSGGPAVIPGLGQRTVLRYMFMTKDTDTRKKSTVFTFYTYDNYEQDGRRFVCHRMLFYYNKKKKKESINYDSWSTKVFFIYEEQLCSILEKCGFLGVKEESPDEEHFKLEKNWYVVAQKPIA